MINVDQLEKDIKLLEQLGDLFTRLNKTPNCKVKSDLKVAVEAALNGIQSGALQPLTASDAFQAYWSAAEDDVLVIRFCEKQVLVRAKKGAEPEYSTDDCRTWKPGKVPSSGLHSIPSAKKAFI